MNHALHPAIQLEDRDEEANEVLNIHPSVLSPSQIKLLCRCLSFCSTPEAKDYDFSDQTIFHVFTKGWRHQTQENHPTAETPSNQKKKTRKRHKTAIVS